MEFILANKRIMESTGTISTESETTNTTAEVANNMSISASSVSTSVLPYPFARLVSSVSTLTRLSIKTADLLSNVVFMGVKVSTKSCLSLSKSAFIRSVGLLESADNLRRMLVRRDGLTQEQSDNIYLILLTLAIDKGFGTLESLLEGGIDKLSYLTTTSLRSADDLLHLMDGVFGSTETSHAVSKFLCLIKHELFTDREGSPSLSQLGLHNVLKAGLAYSLLQNRNRPRILESIPHRTLLTVYITSTDFEYATSSPPVNEQIRLLFDEENQITQESQSEDTPKDNTEIHWDILSSALSACPSLCSVLSSTAPEENRNLKPFHTSFAHILQNLCFLSRLSSSMYGRRFLRAFGMGTYARSTNYPIPDRFGRLHIENHHTFSSHTKIPLESIIGSSYDEDSLTNIPKPKLRTPEYIVAVDDQRKLVVATLRGTYGLSDVLTSLTCHSAKVSINGKDFWVHGGMLMQAQILASHNGRFHEYIRESLESNPGYALVLNGHSLGGGVASLLGLLWCNLWVEDVSSYAFCTSLKSGLPSHRPLHVYVFGSPCVMCVDLARVVRGLVTGIVNGHDFVSRLSLGGVRDLKQVTELLSLEKDGTICNDIISKSLRKVNAVPVQEETTPVNVILYDDAESDAEPHESSSGTNSENEKESLKDENDWCYSIHKALIASSNHHKLFPPGDVYWISTEDASCKMSSVHNLKDDHFEDRAESMTSPLQASAQNGSSSDKNSSSSECSSILKLVYVDDVEKMFGEMQFSKSMISDHFPGQYEWVLETLYANTYKSKP